MTSPSRRPRFRESGAAIVEFAVCVSLLFLLVGGIIEVGYYANAGIVVAHAAGAGVGYGAQNNITAADTTGMEQAAVNDGSDLPGLTAVASYSCTCANGDTPAACESEDCSGSYLTILVQVTASATIPALVAIPGIPSSLTISQTATRQVEQ